MSRICSASAPGQELQEQEDRAAQAREALASTQKELDKVTEDRDAANGAAQGDLNGHGVLVGDVEQPRHRAPDSPQPAPLG